MINTRRGFVMSCLSFLCAACASDKVMFSSFEHKLTRKYTLDSKQFVDHTPWARLLTKYVLVESDGNNLILYGNFTMEDRTHLDHYINGLCVFPIETLNRREQYAFWLNLYNALVVRLVLSRYLILSINDIKFGFTPLTRSPFQQKLVSIKDEPLSLSDIRQNILIPLFDDPRIHYGLCDAAIGSPNIQTKPFTGDWVDRMLDGAALDFINHPKGLKIQNGGVILSGVFENHPNEFGAGLYRNLLHIKNYAMPGLLDEIDIKIPVRYEFNWSLNDGTGIKNKKS
jgi:hypothetical protein